MHSKDIKNFFFLGIGGIGMSALARYFHHRGYPVFGYDRTPSPLTRELEKEGIEITYIDAVSKLNGLGLDRKYTLIVRTPAVPEDCEIYTYLRREGFDIRKRAEVLGIVTQRMKALCVAGTHGKTTTSTMIAHLMHPVNAFLGGISENYHTNLLLSKESEYVVVEADEYDRSFHHLTPFISVVTAVDADHLDIYGTPEAYREAFAHYTSLITGALVMKHGIELEPRLKEGVECYTYGADTTLPDFYAKNIRVRDGQIVFDYVMPDGQIKDVQLGVPVWVNIENAVAAMAVAHLCGIKDEAMREAMASFKGVQRRFNIHVNTPKVAYIDDYAHHPQEIATAIDSIRKLFPERKLIGVFQPHLYTRTRDFAEGFRAVLGTLDECVLLPIYPAREEPIPGVTSEMLGGEVVEKPALVAELIRRVQQSHEPVVVLTVGAGDIDRLVPDITRALKEKLENE
ncbi:MAG: UDP-N-acetylmuramate--L-alanine ligase [Paludibacteraceae bacterium]|nr:UDP-N-acetylmuramate--L-alanine ligase [Paludibacteraceae bacterium]